MKSNNKLFAYPTTYSQMYIIVALDSSKIKIDNHTTTIPVEQK